jgi:hypothetical protein
MNGYLSRLFFPALILALGLTSSVFGQQASSDAAFIAPTHPRQPTETTTVEKPSSMDITGIVAQAFHMKKPLQLISPLAPAKEGDGRNNVSWDPDKAEKPKGIILFGIQW